MAEDFSIKNLNSKVQKNYKQKFRACWTNGEFSNWLIRCPDNPDSPYCKLCCRKIEGGITHLRRHASSTIHQKKCSKFHLSAEGIHDTINPLREYTPPKALKVKHKKSNKIRDSIRENSSVELSCLPNTTIEAKATTNSFMEAPSEESQPLQIACVSVPHLATQHNGVDVEEGQHQSKHTTSISLNPAIHHSPYIESALSLPSVVTSHVNAEYNNHLCNNGHLQPLHVHHNVQVSDVQSKFTEHSEIFTSNISSPTKLQNETYLMELNDVGSSCEVTASSSHSSCQGITSLQPDHHAQHITVTIQGQDPMYIHSSVNPDSHIEYAAVEQTESISSTPLISRVEEPTLSTRPKKRKGKSKRLCKSRKENRRDSADTAHQEDRLDSSHQNGSKSGTDEDGKDYKRSCKWYRQKYKQNWEKSKEFMGWLSPAPSDPSMAFCVACSKGLRGGLTHLKRHADTPYHKKRMVETIKKRELISAKNIELRLSKFAHEFGLSDRAACALPELFKNLFPDNNLCKLLSDDRILAMLLVHQEDNNPSLRLWRAEEKSGENSSNSRTESSHCHIKSSVSSEHEDPDCVDVKSVVPHAQSRDSLDPMHLNFVSVEEERAPLQPSVSSSASTSIVPTTTAPHIMSTMDHGMCLSGDQGLHTFVRCSGEMETGHYSDSVNTIVTGERPVTVVQPTRGALMVQQLDTCDAFKACTRSVLHHSSSPLTGSDHERWQGKVAIVADAGDGIGSATCHALVALGMRVVGLARSQHRMQELAKEVSGERGSLTALQCDLSKDEDVERAFAEVLRIHGAVHCCVNNAGFSTNTSLLDGSPSEWRDMLDVNVVGLCLLTKLCVTSMMKKSITDGHIVHISGTSDHHTGSSPSVHLFADATYALKTLTDCLRRELRKARSHIRVSSISRGCVGNADDAADGEPSAVEGGVRPDHVAASVLHVLAAPPCVEINISMRATQQAS